MSKDGENGDSDVGLAASLMSPGRSHKPLSVAKSLHYFHSSYNVDGAQHSETSLSTKDF